MLIIVHLIESDSSNENAFRPGLGFHNCPLLSHVKSQQAPGAIIDLLLMYTARRIVMFIPWRKNVLPPLLLWCRVKSSVYDSLPRLNCIEFENQTQVDFDTYNFRAKSDHTSSPQELDNSFQDIQLVHKHTVKK